MARPFGYSAIGASIGAMDAVMAKIHVPRKRHMCGMMATGAACE
ncbi:MAG TPA: hypothetical protein VLV32_00160 [Burkholderiales bacterium]|nr:hypothetical protein [Burkholderiales bacterium]